MIVDRYTHTARAGRRGELVELLKGWVEGAGAPGRVLTPGWTDWDKVELDLEFETEQDLDKFWADYDRRRPEVAELHERIDDLRESGGSTRVIWHTE